MHYALVAFGILCGLISFVISIKDLAKAFSAKDENAEMIAPMNENEDATTEVDLNDPSSHSHSSTTLPLTGGLRLL